MKKAKVRRVHKQAKRLKGKKGIKNPYALAASQVKKGQRWGSRKKPA